MKSFWIIIWEIISLLVGEAADVSRRVAVLGQQELQDGVPVQVQDVKMYLKALKKLALYTIIFPAPILIMGIIGGLGWLVSLVGIFWALCTLLLLLVAAPLGVLIEALLGGVAGSGKRYVQLILGIFLIELTFTLFVAVVPIGQNLSVLPIAVIAAVVLGILGAMGTKTLLTKKLVSIFAGAVLVISIIFFYFPQGIVKGLVGEKEITTTTSQPRAAVAHLPLCTGGTYNFADAKVPGEVEVDFRPDCLSEVTLPPSVTFRTDPSSDIKIIFIDGSPYVDGPGRQVWYGLKRGVFKMHGVTEAGILKISFEKKS